MIALPWSVGVLGWLAIATLVLAVAMIVWSVIKCIKKHS